MSAKSNKIGVVQLTILTMVNMMGSGIIMLPTKLAEIGTISDVYKRQLSVVAFLFSAS